MCTHCSPCYAHHSTLCSCGLQDEVLLAYQIGFDLFENEMQTFSEQVWKIFQDRVPPMQHQPYTVALLCTS